MVNNYGSGQFFKMDFTYQLSLINKLFSRIRKAKFAVSKNDHLDFCEAI